MAYTAITFQNGVNGASFDVADEAGVGDIIGLASFVYDNSDNIAGALSLRSGQESGPSYLTHPLPASTTRAYQSLYVKVDRDDHTWLCGSLGTGFGYSPPLSSARIRGDSGLAQLRDRYVADDTGAYAHSAGQWVRVDHDINLAGNSQTMGFFYGANLHGTTPDYTLSGGLDDLGATTISDLVIGPYAGDPTSTPLYGVWTVSTDEVPPPYPDQGGGGPTFTTYVMHNGTEIAADSIAVMHNGTETALDSISVIGA